MRKQEYHKPSVNPDTIVKKEFDMTAETSTDTVQKNQRHIKTFLRHTIRHQYQQTRRTGKVKCCANKDTTVIMEPGANVAASASIVQKEVMSRNKQTKDTTLDQKE